MHKIHTKIICTMGPSVNSIEKISELIQAGMNVARLNFSHGTHEQHQEIIRKIKKAREKLQKPVAILLDTKGPEIRIGKVKNEEIKVKEKDILRLVKNNTDKEKDIPVFPFEVLENIKPEIKVLSMMVILFLGLLERKGFYRSRIENSGVIKSGKGVNIPQAELNLPAVTEKDVQDLRFGCQNDIDIIAASFIRSAEHVLTIKKLLAEEKRPDIPIIAKVENIQGVENFDAILEVADGIMIARGDLGVEINVGQVPRIQKIIIRKCYLAFKPVVTATQMLESMINNPRPTRAEVSDVANAIYDSTSLVMLSGETAIGKYPLEVVKQMKNIISNRRRFRLF